jgi:hypothetical protein
MAAALCLLPFAAWAQDGLRSASLPERPLTSRPSPALGDLFRAEPDTYTPRRQRPNIYALPIVVLPRYGSLGDAYYISPTPYGNVPCAGVVRGCPVSSYYQGDRRDRHHAHRHGYVGRVPRPSTRSAGSGSTVSKVEPSTSSGRPEHVEGRSGPADTPPGPADTPSVAAPGPPKTFYVIAGCYAGDKPPRPEWLAPGCDPSNVRAVGP